MPRPRSGGGPLHPLVDGTGLRPGGAGERPVEKHGARARRAWRKSPPGVDVGTGRIGAVERPATSGDGSRVGPLLDQLEGAAAPLTGDGARDREDACDAVAERHPEAAAVVPPRRDAAPGAAAGAEPTRRDRHPRPIAGHGRAGRQKASGYDRRASAESAVSRYERVVGDALRPRTDRRRAAEVAVAVRAPNRMPEPGRPESVRVA